MAPLRGNTLLPAIDRPVPLDALPRTAVLTCDIEPDYGGRTGTKELLENGDYAASLLAWSAKQGTPLSAFVVTSLLAEPLPAIDVLRAHGTDLHCHAYTHDVRAYRTRSREEIARAQEAFTASFGKPAPGYRAPQGLFLPGDEEELARHGFSFDSSVFPGWRPGLFDFRMLPREPWTWRGGVLELPLAATSGRRLLTVSHVKLRGRFLWERILRRDSLPPVLILDSHLHDFFPPSSRRGLPWSLRLAYARNRGRGMALLDWLIGVLRERGYRFRTMTELAADLRAPLRA